MKENAGSYAVFAAQGSSASRMTAPKVMDVMARLPGCAEQSLHPSQNGGRSTIVENSWVRVSRYLDTSTTTQVAKILVQH